jgi:hypothetical protein
MRQLATAAVFVLLLPGGLRPEERQRGAAPKKELQPPQGVWIAGPRGADWEIALAINGRGGRLGRSTTRTRPRGWKRSGRPVRSSPPPGR